jgi:hypothetical protein
MRPMVAMVVVVVMFSRVATPVHEIQNPYFTFARPR